MSDFIVVNNTTYIQYKIIEVAGEKKVFSMSGKESNVTYAEVERGLAANKYKKM